MRKGSRKGKHTITIGVAGAEGGVGTTHLAIMLANYLASKEKCRSALADMSQEQSIEALWQIYEGGTLEATQKQHVFRMYGVDYYSGLTGKDIAGILQMGYEYTIFDFGRVSFARYEQEIMRCHVRILLGSCCEWEKQAFETALDRRMQFQDPGVWKYAAFVGTDSIVRKFEKRYHIKICRIPFEEDPFRLHRNHFEVFHQLLQEE